MGKRRTGHVQDEKTGKVHITKEPKNKGNLDMEGTTKKSWGLGDSIKTFRQGR